MITFLQFISENATARLFGWFTPGAKFIDTGMYGHLSSEVVNGNPEIKRLIPWYDAEYAELEEDRKETEARSERGEHPEWHSYETAEHEFHAGIVKTLYQAGFLRVGTFRDEVRFEGTAEGIKSLFPYAKELAETHGLKPYFDPVRPKGQR